MMEDPLLFLGIFTVVNVACNVLLAWSITGLAKTIRIMLNPETKSSKNEVVAQRRGPGRPKGAVDVKPRKPYTRTVPQQESPEDVIEWFLKQSESQQ